MIYNDSLIESDIRAHLDRLNLIELYTTSIYCTVLTKWVITDNRKCSICDKTGIDHKCFLVGGKNVPVNQGLYWEVENE